MSYDDKDRHEIAARLRSKKPEEFGPRYGRNVLEHIFHSLFPKQVYPVSNWVLRMPYTLADLIDRPTCRMVEVKTGEVADYRDTDEIIFHCKSCHTERGIFSYDEDGNVYSARPEYCPNCGAKVVDDD